MKEITKWNGNPRMMWVWNDFYTRTKQKVIYIAESEKEDFKVCSLDKNGDVYFNLHCAEIEPLEVTEWNGTPREMWVWKGDIEDFEKNKKKCKVIYIEDLYKCYLPPVIAVEEGRYARFDHCAELDCPSKIIKIE